MKVSCYLHKFDERWDKKLKQLIDEGLVTEVNKHTVKFKLKSGTKIIRRWFVKKEVDTFDYYTVWVSNKSCAYGRLCKINDDLVPDYFSFSASKEVLSELFELETKLRHPMILKVYSKQP